MDSNHASKTRLFSTLNLYPDDVEHGDLQQTTLWKIISAAKSGVSIKFRLKKGRIWYFGDSEQDPLRSVKAIRARDRKIAKNSKF